MEQQRKQLVQSQKIVLREIIAAARTVLRPEKTRGHKPVGVKVLFTGANAEVKALAINTLAKDLGVDHYRVNLTRLISKYIGETEKNLRREFKTAESKTVILLLDEADALFGKRTCVKDSHDRYANIEINYLLEQIERFHGIVILAMNLRHNIDPTILCRFQFVMNFQQ